MRLSIEQLNAFYEVASERSFSAAARKLKKSQSALSIAVANLETDLGVTLFDRTGRYPVLTHNGKSLLRDAEAILQQCASMENRAYGLAAELENEVTLAIDDTIPFALLASNLNEFAHLFPFVDLNLLHPSSSYVQNLVEQKNAGLGIMCAGENYPAHINFKRLGYIVFANVVHKDHPLAKFEEVTFEQLSQYRNLVYSPLQNVLPTSEYLRGPRQWRMESYLNLIHMLSSGLGWATVPKQVLSDSKVKGELVELHLTSYPFTEWMVGVDLIWSTEHRLGKAAEWLKGALGNTPL